MADITKYLDGLNYTITAEEKCLMDIFAEAWEYCKGRDCSDCEYRGEGNEYVKPLLCMSYQYAKRLIAAGYRNVTPPAEAVRVGREPSGFTDMRGKTICNGDIVMCHNNPKDICKVVLGEFDVIELETFETVENVVGWHTEVIPTADPLSKVEPFNLTMPLNKFYLERSEMVVIGNIYDNPGLLEANEND